MSNRLPESHSGWHSRGSLPHFDGGVRPDSLPSDCTTRYQNQLLLRWKDELKHERPGEVEDVMRRRVAASLNQGHGHCHLKEPAIATLVQNALVFHDQTKYLLAAWTIMPNHVHLLCAPVWGHDLAEIMHALKSFTSHEANKILGRKGPFWQKEYFDRCIRNARNFAKALAYIENNPVKARLCDKAEDWPFGSAFLRKG